MHACMRAGLFTWREKSRTNSRCCCLGIHVCKFVWIQVKILFCWQKHGKVCCYSNRDESYKGEEEAAAAAAGLKLDILGLSLLWKETKEEEFTLSLSYQSCSCRRHQQQVGMESLQTDGQTHFKSMFCSSDYLAVHALLSRWLCS